MINLLEETTEVLKKYNKSLSDIVWCGSEEFGWFSVDDFKRLANFKYDDGYGGEEVATDLLIVGKDFWLERHEYDGSEWWEYKTTPIKPEKNNVPTRLYDTDLGGTLEEMNTEVDEDEN